MGRRSRYDRTPPKQRGPRVNGRIQVPRVLLIDENGTKQGVFDTRDALEIARERELDLIEVSPNARPPVCKLGDWGRMKYEQKKRAAEARKKQHQTQLKELKVRPKTDEHDMAVKSRRARKFLERGDKVKITVWFRGREHAHHDIGAEQCLELARRCGDLATIQQRPQMEGRRMHMILAPA